MVKTDSHAQRRTDAQASEPASVSAPPVDEDLGPLTEEELALLVDPVAKAKLAEHKAAIIELLAGGPKNAWKVGEHIATIVREKLATRAGYRHLGSFVHRELPVRRTSMKKYRRLHETFSETEASDFSLERLTWVYSYLALKGGARPPNLADLPVEVPGPRGGVTTIRFADCSWGDLEAALVAERLHHLGRSAAMRLVAFLNSVLNELTAGRVRVMASPGRRSTRIRLGAFEMKDARAVSEALRRLADEVEAQLKSDPLSVL